MPEVGWQVAGSNARATGEDRSVVLNMQLVIACLFREPDLQLTLIGDGLLCGHKFASKYSVHNGCGDARTPARVIDYKYQVSIDFRPRTPVAT